MLVAHQLQPGAAVMQSQESFLKITKMNKLANPFTPMGGGRSLKQHKNGEFVGFFASGCYKFESIRGLIYL